MILAIETSSPRAGLALWDTEKNELVHEETFSTDRAHNSVIFGFAQKLLEKCDRKLSRIVVGLGPGSYSGVRVGIALANGLGLSMGVQTLGISSLLAYDDAEFPNYVVVGDARRKTRFAAVVQKGRLEREPELIPEGEFSERLNELLREKQMDTVYTPDKNVKSEFPNAQFSQPRASLIARISMAKSSRTKPSPVLDPHYLRPPYITTPKKPPA